MPGRRAPKSAGVMWGRAGSAGIEAGLCVAIGGLVGYYADRWLGTEPWLLLVFLFLGFVAGMRRLFQIRWVPEEASSSGSTNSSSSSSSSSPEDSASSDPPPQRGEGRGDGGDQDGSSS